MVLDSEFLFKDPNIAILKSAWTRLGQVIILAASLSMTVLASDHTLKYRLRLAVSLSSGSVSVDHVTLEDQLQVMRRRPLSHHILDKILLDPDLW